MRLFSRLLLLIALASCVPKTSGTGTAPPSASSVAAPKPPPKPVMLARVGSRYGAPLVLAKAGARMLAVSIDSDAERLHVVDLDAAKEIASLPVAAPSAVVVLEAYVVVVTRTGLVHATLDEDDRLRPLRTDAIEGASAIAIAPDEKSLLVGTDAACEIRDAKTSEKTASFPLPAPASGIAIDPDGKHALVASKTSSQITVIDLAKGAGKPTSLDASAQDVEPTGTEIWDPEGREWSFNGGMGTLAMIRGKEDIPLRARHASALAAANEFAYVAHELLLPTSPEEETMEFDPERKVPAGYGGTALSGTEFLGVSILDARSGKRVSFYPAAVKCRLPRGQAFDVAKRRLFVACAGTNEVVTLSFERKIVVESGRRLRLPPAYRGTSLALPGPADGVAYDAEHDRLVASTLFGSQLTIKPAEGPPKVVDLARDAPRLDARQLRGRILFHRAADPRISFDGRACATCHVDGRADNLVWKTKLGPRSTPILAGRADRTGPFGWNGESADLAKHVGTTITKNLGGKGLTDEEIADLTAYVRSMALPPASHSELAARGEKVFGSPSVGCASCHLEGGRSTDNEVHVLGKKGGKFLTPPLVGLSRSAPYFHDGRFASLEDLLAKTDGTMGSTKNLSADDRGALLAYLRSL